MALREMFPGDVEWVSTRPITFSEKIKFHRDPAGWWGNLIESINNASCRMAFFISYRNEFQSLKPSDRNILYLVDDVRLRPGDTEPFGRVYLSDPGYIPELQAVTPASKYGGVLPFAFHPALHSPEPSCARSKGDVCFIGNRDDKRDVYLARLLREKNRSLIVGNYFLKSDLFWRNPMSFRPSVANEAMGRIYARHRISLNIHAKVVRQGTNMRTFECAGYGIPQVVEHREQIEAYFEPGKEILCFRDEEEMMEQIRALLRDPMRASRMAEAARSRALAEHTYRHRVETILRDL